MINLNLISYKLGVLQLIKKKNILLEFKGSGQSGFNIWSKWPTN